jgi:hypothetical protein
VAEGRVEVEVLTGVARMVWVAGAAACAEDDDKDNEGDGCCKEKLKLQWSSQFP